MGKIQNNSGNEQSEKLALRFEKKAKNGLLDVKFYVRNREETSVEQVCTEVNMMYDAIERGELSPIDLGDSHK